MQPVLETIGMLVLSVLFKKHLDIVERKKEADLQFARAIAMHRDTSDKACAINCALDNTSESLKLWKRA